jgi:hypothetical protein
MLDFEDDLQRDGKVLYTACSNFEAWRLTAALWIGETKGWASFSAYLPQCRLVVRDVARATLVGRSGPTRLVKNDMRRRSPAVAEQGGSAYPACRACRIV